VAERERTKHVHRLHPYLGKFIPQLVEWFLARHFRPGDTILDPFMGSGTTLVQANEMRMRALGVDISEFNCRIARAKTERYDLSRARRDVLDAEERTRRFSERVVSLQNGSRREGDAQFQEECAQRLRECGSEYLHTWFAPRALLEILYYRDLIERGECRYPDLLRVLLSRAARSSRLVPHDDLATPRSPLRVGVSYHCTKHGRRCFPIDNCITKIHAYSADTLRRLTAFAAIRSTEPITVLRADSRTANLSAALDGRKADGVFTSPPYVGQIDYHDQHNYAYELFGIERNDGLEIGPRFRGKSARAQREYVDGIVAALRNVARFLAPEAKVFIVANDRLSLYPEIARQAGFTIVEELHRAVTKRTEKGDDPYRETVFHLRPTGPADARA
jgi:DNA modification methylase